MAKIFSWKINNTSNYAYLCTVPDPESGETHISNYRIDDQVILGKIKDFLLSKTQQEVINLYSEMIDEVDQKFASHDLPNVLDYTNGIDYYWSMNPVSGPSNIILISGKNGVDGADGVGGSGGGSGSGAGTQGPRGEKGATGKQGKAGADGRDGQDGANGRDGVDGANAPYFELYYFAADIEPTNDGHPSGGIIPLFSSGDEAPYWGTSDADKIESHKCKKEIPTIGSTKPYRYTTQRYYDGNSFGSFQDFVLDAAYITAELSDDELEEIERNITSSLQGTISDAMDDIANAQAEFGELRQNIISAATVANEAYSNSVEAVDRAQQAAADAQNAVSTSQNAINSVRGEITAAIESFSGAVGGISATTDGFRTRFVEMQQDLENFSGSMTTFVTDASGIFSDALLASSGLTGASVYASQLRQTADEIGVDLSVLEESANTITSKKNQLVIAVDGIEGRIEQATQDLASSGDIHTKIAEYELGINGLKSSLVDIETSGTDLTSRTSELSNTITGLSQTVTNYTISAETAVGTFAQLNSGIQGLEHRMENVSISAGTYDTVITDLTNDLSGLHQSIEEYESDYETFSSTTVSSLENTIEGFRTKVSVLKQSGYTLNYSLSSLEAVVGRISAEISDAELSADTFSARLVRMEMSATGITSRVEATESGVTSAWTAVSELTQDVSGLTYQMSQIDTEKLVTVEAKIGQLSGAVGAKIVALSSTTSSITASVNEMRNDYNQFVVASSEWKKGIDKKTFVTKSYDEDDKSTWIENYIGEPEELKQYVYYAKISGITPQCLYGKYIPNTTYDGGSDTTDTNYKAGILAYSGWFYTDKEETQVFDGKIRNASTNQVIVDIYEKHDMVENAVGFTISSGDTYDVGNLNNFNMYFGYYPIIHKPFDGWWQNTGVYDGNSNLGYAGFMETRVAEFTYGSNNYGPFYLRYDGSLRYVDGFDSEDYYKHLIETYYAPLETGTTSVCGSAMSIGDFIQKYCYSVISDFSGVKQTPSAINQWVKNADTAAQIAMGINSGGSSVAISADHIYTKGGTLQAEFNGVSIVTAVNDVKNTNGTTVPYNYGTDEIFTRNDLRTNNLRDLIRTNSTASGLTTNKKAENAIWVFKTSSGSSSEYYYDEYIVKYPNGKRSEAILEHVGVYEPNGGGVLQIDADKVHITGELIASKLSAHTGTIAGINFSNQTIQSSNFTASNGTQGFCIDMASGVISANTIYLGGGSSGGGGSSSGGTSSGGTDENAIHFGYNYEGHGSSFQVSREGLLMAKNAILEGTVYANQGYIGGIKIYDNTIEADRFILDQSGKLFAAGIEIAGDGLVINKNEILYSKINQNGEDVIISINNKGYSSLDEFGSPTKDANITHGVSSSSTITIFSASTSSLGSTNIRIGGDSYKGCAFLCSATSVNGNSSVKISGTVRYTISVTDATVASTDSGYIPVQRQTSTYTRTPYRDGRYVSQNDSQEDTRASILLNYGDITLSSLVLFTDVLTTRQGSITVGCSTGNGYSWIAKSSDGLINGNSSATGTSGSSFTIVFPNGYTEGIYYIEVDYANNDGVPTGLGALITIHNLSTDQGGTGHDWLQAVASVSSKNFINQEEVIMPLIVDSTTIDNKETKTKKKDIVLGSNNVIENNELEDNTKNQSTVLGSVSNNVSYEITINSPNVYLVKDNERVGSVLGTASSSTNTALTITVPINGEFKLSKTLNGGYYLLGLGGEINGNVAFSASSGYKIVSTVVTCKAELLPGFSITSKPLNDYTEIFTNGLGYFGDGNNYFVVQKQPGEPLEYRIKSGGQIVLGGTQVIDITMAGSSVQTYRTYIDELESRNVQIISSNENTIRYFVLTFPGRDAVYNKLNLKPGDTYNFYFLRIYNDVAIQFEIEWPQNPTCIDTVVYGNSCWSNLSQEYITSCGNGSNGVKHVKLIYMGIRYGGSGQYNQRYWLIE